jgi:exonuclease SbcD
MRFLHTSDWHVGKTIRGHSRLDEHTRVLAEITELTSREHVDVVLVVGDLFESPVPAPDAQRLVNQTLLDLRATGAEVLVVAGNHDHPPAFESWRNVFAATGVTMLGNVGSDNVVTVDRGGERALVALAPWVSQRYLVRAEQVLSLSAAEMASLYADRVGRLYDALCAPLRDRDVIGVLAAHCFVRGGLLGGGERDAQTINDYGVDPAAFPSHLHYVALGHLHRHQTVSARVPSRYCGSPIAVDFGEETDAKGVVLVDAQADAPAQARFVALSSPTPLRTVKGTFDELREQAGTTGEAWLRVRVTDGARAGLADQVREWFPLAVDVAVVRDHDERTRARSGGDTRRHRTPHDLFADYCGQEAIVDDRVVALFDELHADLVG